MVNIDDYDYFLPPSLIAQKPAVPRDMSKLLVYNTLTDEIFIDRFLNIDKHLPKKSFLVMNNTKVLPSRVTLYKQTGGKLKVLFLVNEAKDLWGSGKEKYPIIIKALVDREVKVNDRISFNPSANSGQDRYFLTVIDQKEKIFYLRLDFDKAIFLKLLNEHGHMPIPLYIKNSPLTESELRKKYQTVFADKIGSAAAPTASLHFTKRVLKKIERKGIERAFVTLNVGMGTFAPIDENNIKKQKLHEEYYEVTKSTAVKIDQWKTEGLKTVAVGTTVVRALESFYSSSGSAATLLPASALPPISVMRAVGIPSDRVTRSTDIFIFPPFKFKAVDILITNFHLPKSSLMMLVEAFLQHKKSKRSIVNLYDIAIKNSFRFYSFGDTMLIK